MKIKKVKWDNHPILGNLELDFTDAATGEPFNNVIFSGENGSGKTSILESISTFLNLGSFEHFEYIEYAINNQIYKAIQQNAIPNHKSFFQLVSPDGSHKDILSDKNNRPENIKSNNLDLRHYGCVFSKARADYKTDPILSTTTKTLDIEKHDNDDNDNFTSLKQLVIDVENQDNADYAEQNKNLVTKAKLWSDFYLESKIYRFKNAFDSFFDKLKYDKVVDSKSEKSILFTKNGKTISIDRLSTGEKQIVFRGIHLLKNSKNLYDAVAFIDEPELSMHPKWQRNILKYYKDLFTEAGTQKTQLFFASHSEHVLKIALENKNSDLVVVVNDVNGTVTAKRIDAPAAVLPTITVAETSYLAFDIVSNDYHIELYGWLQDKESVNTIKKCDEFIKNSSFYNPVIHSKPSPHPNGTTTYETLSTFIRNTINHPSPGQVYSDIELRTSIELLIELCR